MKKFCVRLLPLFLFGCVIQPPRRPRSVIEIREIQTRFFDTKDAKAVQKAIFDVLQDDDYIVRNAVIELGLLTAVKQRALQPGRSSSGVGFGFGVSPWAMSSTDQTWPAAEEYEATINVSPFGSKTKVRVNVQRRVLNNRGGVVDSEVVEDPKFYQDLFVRVDKGLYLQRERL